MYTIQYTYTYKLKYTIYIHRTKTHSNMFVSSVCHRPNTNHILAANSQGIIGIFKLE